MAAEVSCMVRSLINGGDAKESPTAPITRDFLAGYCTLDSQELDLDLQVPSGWEKRLDLKSGKVYLQRCNTNNNSCSSQENISNIIKSGGGMSKFQDLNFPPSSKQTLNLLVEADANLDLKLLSSSPPPSSANSPCYQSVCTLDKVRSALERAEKEETTTATVLGKRSMSVLTSKSSSRSNSSSSIKENDDYKGVDQKSTASCATGCPTCLMYVLISRSNPKCPRCSSIVPLPFAAANKKPRIDLNMSI